MSVQDLLSVLLSLPAFVNEHSHLKAFSAEIIYAYISDLGLHLNVFYEIRQISVQFFLELLLFGLH